MRVRRRITYQTFYLFTFVLLVVIGAAMDQFVHAETKAKPKAADCEYCVKERQRLNDLEMKLQKESELLGKNRAYLLNIDPKAVSKVIKIDSNIMMIMQRADAMKKEMAQLEVSMQNRGCDSCQNKTKDP